MSASQLKDLLPKEVGPKVTVRRVIEYRHKFIVSRIIIAGSGQHFVIVELR